LETHLKIRIIIVGKLVKNYLKEGVHEYLKMISRYVTIELEVAKEEKITDGKPVTQILVKEAERILAKISDRDFVVILDAHGEQLSSAAFASFLQRRMQAPYKSMVFIIGGPHGLYETVKTRANHRLSLSIMTFAHELCMVVLLEQIYRSLSILHGSKYHK